MSAISCIVVLGPTATGKTRLGVELTHQFDGEIVSVDSRQVYRGMDLGTGKDLAEYGRIRYHLIDVVAPHEDYHLFRYLAEARAAIADITRRNRLPILVGGTALYLNALLDGYAMPGGEPDPAMRQSLEKFDTATLCAMLSREAPAIFARTDQTQRRRILRALEIARSPQPDQAAPALPLQPLLLAPYYPRPVVQQRISARLDARLNAGLVDEVRQLHDAQGLSWERLDFFGLEYRYVAKHLQAELSFAEMRQTLAARIRRLCKSQDIWYRKMERAGKPIYWIPNGELEPAIALAERFCAGEPLPAPTFRLMDHLNGPQTN